jgi:ring-1,2-phenylacetyl-CoA epoxidase subunit PaaD
MVSREIILDALRGIPDPELPISIVELGLVQDIALDRAGARIELLPTFVGCPALHMIADEVKRTVAALEGVSHVEVRWSFDPPWTVDRISASGRESLRAHGVGVPDAGRLHHAAVSSAGGDAGAKPVAITLGGSRPAPAAASAMPSAMTSATASAAGAASQQPAAPVACPFCGSGATRMESMFGPTRCRSIWYCDACRNSFEQMKRL